MSILIKRITEIGVAVKHLTLAGNEFHEILGAQGGIVLDSPEYDMAVQMFRAGNIEFELMQPASPQGIIAQFLKKRGEGLHHLAFEVAGLQRILKELRVRVVGIGSLVKPFLPIFAINRHITSFVVVVPITGDWNSDLDVEDIIIGIGCRHQPVPLPPVRV